MIFLNLKSKIQTPKVYIRILFSKQRTTRRENIWMAGKRWSKKKRIEGFLIAAQAIKTRSIRTNDDIRDISAAWQFCGEEDEIIAPVELECTTFARKTDKKKLLGIYVGIFFQIFEFECADKLSNPKPEKGTLMMT